MLRAVHAGSGLADRAGHRRERHQLARLPPQDPSGAQRNARRKDARVGKRSSSLRAPVQKSEHRSLVQVYWWNQSVVAEGQWVTVDTTALKDFPLFYRRPV